MQAARRGPVDCVFDVLSDREVRHQALWPLSASPPRLRQAQFRARVSWLTASGWMLLFAASHQSAFEGWRHTRVPVAGGVVAE
jgi:hypothetical protein